LDIVHDAAQAATFFRPVIGVRGFRQTSATVVYFWREPIGIIKLFDGTGKTLWGLIDLAEDRKTSLPPEEQVPGVVEALKAAVRIALRLLYQEYQDLIDRFRDQLEQLQDELPLYYSEHLKRHLFVSEDPETGVVQGD
jgi:hypothetical protein